MKRKAQLLALAAMAQAMSADVGLLSRKREIVDHGWKSKEQLEKDRERLLLKKGLRWFNINGVSILALNQKSAEKKYNKQLKQQ